MRRGSEDKAVRLLFAEPHCIQGSSDGRLLRPQLPSPNFPCGDDGHVIAQGWVCENEFPQVRLVRDAARHPAPFPAPRALPAADQRRDVAKRDSPEAFLIEQIGSATAQQARHVEERMVAAYIGVPLLQAPRLQHAPVRIGFHQVSTEMRRRLQSSICRRGCARDGIRDEATRLTFARRVGDDTVASGADDTLELLCRHARGHRKPNLFVGLAAADVVGRDAQQDFPRRPRRRTLSQVRGQRCSATTLQGNLPLHPKRRPQRPQKCGRRLIGGQRATDARIGGHRVLRVHGDPDGGAAHRGGGGGLSHPARSATGRADPN
mmetsp:Transcript_121825/g.389553  ORF Transcript_121825/g.389553 Transcript_121825/m.389553 type:complete len:320 (-) Transcript_121825:8-967(-)